MAFFIFFVEAIAAVLGGFCIIASDFDLFLVGFLVMIVGPIIAYVSSWLLYGFGELIDKASKIEEKMDNK